MQIVLFQRSVWKFGRIPGPGAFVYARLGRVELRIGGGRFMLPWGRPASDWAYAQG
jgi:hypothetical protein